MTYLREQKVPEPVLIKDLAEQVIAAAKLFELQISDQQVELFNRYINLLAKWNKAFNLTAVRNIDEMLNRHLVDSLSIAQYIEGARFIDVGTGPGLPGIPLAILFPNKQFYLLDSNGKKSRFQQQAKLELSLDNIEVINSRVDEYQPEALFDGILSRAFATLDDMINGSAHLCKTGGHYYAMKGLYPEDELQQISKPYKVQTMHWQGNNTERHLVIIKQ